MVSSTVLFSFFSTLVTFMNSSSCGREAAFLKRSAAAPYTFETIFYQIQAGLTSPNFVFSQEFFANLRFFSAGSRYSRPPPGGTPPSPAFRRRPGGGFPRGDGRSSTGSPGTAPAGPGSPGSGTPGTGAGSGESRTSPAPPPPSETPPGVKAPG